MITRRVITPDWEWKIEVESWKLRVKDLQAEVKELREALANAKIKHLIVEDCWYSCPKSGECCDDREMEQEQAECNCGADAHNQAIDKVLGE